MLQRRLSRTRRLDKHAFSYSVLYKKRDDASAELCQALYSRHFLPPCAVSEARRVLILSLAIQLQGECIADGVTCTWFIRNVVSISLHERRESNIE